MMGSGQSNAHQTIEVQKPVQKNGTSQSRETEQRTQQANNEDKNGSNGEGTNRQIQMIYPLKDGETLKPSDKIPEKPKEDTNSAQAVTSKTADIESGTHGKDTQQIGGSDAVKSPVGAAGAQAKPSHTEEQIKKKILKEYALSYSSSDGPASVTKADYQVTKADYHISSPRTHTSVFHIQCNSSQADTSRSKFQTRGVQNQISNEHVQESISNAPDNSLQIQGNRNRSQTQSSNDKAHTDSSESKTSNSQIRTDSSEISKTSTTAGTLQGKQQTEDQKKILKEDQMRQLDDLKKKADENEAKITQAMAVKGIKPLAKDQENTLMQAVSGDVDMVCPSSTNIVRIFTSSTFTDTKNERNMLMKHTYPKIKGHCRKLGYEFQVVDMRWGIRDEATDDHMGTELCLKELKLCQDVSTGPSFISLLSHKYGYTAFPRVIDAKEFEMIMEGMEEEENRKLCMRWYTKDDNAVPSAYVLSPVSTFLPGFISLDPELKKSAKQIWWDESERMQDALNVTATKVYNKEVARKYIMSVSETEIQQGILRYENPSKHTLWFRRNIEDIDKQPSCYLLSRFIECTGPEKSWKKARELHRELTEERMVKKLNPDRIISYSIPWNEESGINPDAEQKHKEYLDKLCDDFLKRMIDMIDKAVAERGEMRDQFNEEYIQHIRFCQTKCVGFQGREDTLELIKQYVQGTSTEPLVIHGPSGTGKTSIMAMAAKMMKKWTSKPPMLVLRFIGTSPDSSSIMRLLDSMVSQITAMYSQRVKPPSQNLNGKIQQFRAALDNGNPDKPLIIMLDSLDQLDPAYDARKLTWLIGNLVPGTKIIVSTLPEPDYDCFPALQKIITTESNFVDIPVLNTNDVKSILDGWLALRNRCLTDQQMTIVLSAFTKCPTPLFLKLSFEEAATWKSFSTVETTVLQDTVRASIDFLFQKLEKNHGPKLVSRALGYLTMANNGATEAELEDILSCDDDVLNDVYMYWTPPIRRLPPLLLVRVRTDLSQYLVERGADGVRVIYWYHRQFIEAAEARYCSNKDTNRLIHERLADFFNGTWAGGRKKPYTSAKGEKGEENRHVSLQPLKFGEKTFNLRTLNNLPYHRIKAGQVDLLKDQCLANPEFLILKLNAVPLHSVLSDFLMAKGAFPEDKLIVQVLEALSLSQKGLATDANQLISQLLQRVKETEDTRMFLQRCREYPHTYLLPTKCVLDQSGGQLVHNISAHGADIDTIDLTADGKLAVTVCEIETEVKIWNVDEGKEQRSVKGMGQCTNALFCNNDTWIACETDRKIIVQDVETGRNVKVLPADGCDSDTAFCTLGKGKRFIMQFVRSTCYLTDLLAEAEDEKIQPFLHPQKMRFGSSSLPRGSENYVAVCCLERYFISVYDLNAREFKPKFRGFEMKDEYGRLREIEVEDLAIFPDETYLAYTTKETSEIVFADFDGNRLRSIPNDLVRKYGSLKFTPNGQFMYLHDKEELYIFNTQSLKQVGCIKQQKRITGVASNDMTTILTVAKDGNMRIFDRSREEKVDKYESTYTRLYNFKFVLTLNNPRYVLLGGRVANNSPTLRLEIYDVFKQEITRKCEMPGLGEPRVDAIRTADPNHVILCIGTNQFVKIDISTMTQVHKYLGFTTDYAFAEDTEEIFCTTKGGMHAKVYDKNGSIAGIMKVGQKQHIMETFVNSTGTTGCAVTDEGPLMLYDVAKRKHMYNIEQGKHGSCFALNMYINRAGTRLMFYSDGKIPEEPKLKVGHLVLWDIENKKEIRRMCDAELEKTYKGMKSLDATSDVEQVVELDNDKVLTCHYDYIMRIWNTDNGTMLQRMAGHKTSLKVTLSSRCPYILSYGSDQEEDCFKLWDRKTYNYEAAFSLDRTVSNAVWSQDGKFFITNKSMNFPDLAMWKVYHGFDHMTVNEADYPENFSTKLDFEPITVKVYEGKNLFEDGDPDSDPGVKSDYDDSDDEDD